jgi:hypothetical protein
MNDATTLAALRTTLAGRLAAAPDLNRHASLAGLKLPLTQLHGAVDATALSAGHFGRAAVVSLGDRSTACVGTLRSRAPSTGSGT